MKKMALLGLGIFLTISCTKTNQKSQVSEVGATPVEVQSKMGDEWEVQYTRIYGRFVEGIKYPVLTIVSSKSELDKYCELLKETYSLSSECINTMNVHSDIFFKNNYLVMVVIQEGSGSIRHKIERIDENGDIFMNRFSPSIQTDDMALWNVMVELDSKFKANSFRVIFNDIVE